MDTPGMVTNWNPEAERIAYHEANASRTDSWVTACGGDEIPMLKDGRWQLYVWNPALRMSGWLDIASDTVTLA